MKLLGRWGRNTPSVVFLHCGHQSWTHSWGWRSWFVSEICFRMRRNFSDTSLIWRDVRRTSRWRRRIRRYKGSWSYGKSLMYLYKSLFLINKLSLVGVFSLSRWASEDHIHTNINSTWRILFSTCLSVSLHVFSGIPRGIPCYLNLAE